MQNDEVIWQILRHKHCSFMSKITEGIFCRNPYNVTGVCNRSSCPLANSRYATIREDDGVFYLYMKTIERAHQPNKMWERVKLPKNYAKALEIIDKNLMYWPKLLIHKIKQRLTKMTQMRIRMRKLALKTREKLMTTPRKELKRERRREEKALVAAALEKALYKELQERLKKGVYNDIYNEPLKEFSKIIENKETELEDVLETEMEEEDDEGETEYVELDEDLELDDDMEDFGSLAINQSHTADDNDDETDEEGNEVKVAIHRKRERKDSAFNLRKLEKKKKARVLVEVEHEEADGRQKAVV